MADMTPRERVEKTLNMQPVDRVALYDLVQNIPFIEYYTGETVTPANAHDLCCKAISCTLDMTRAPGAIAEPRTYEKDGFVFKQEWWTTWLMDRPFNTVEGLREFVKHNIDEVNDWHPGEEWNSWTFKEYQEDFRGDFLHMQEKLGGTVQMFGHSGVGLDTAMNMAGIELFCYLYQDDPELVSSWIEAFNQHETKRIHSIADPTLSPVVLSYNDLADKHSTLFSPAFLRKEFIPRLRKNVEAWHSHGLKVIFHSDGNLWPILDDLVAAGVDGINPLEPIAGMDVARVRELFPDLVLAGGIDCSQLLAYGSVEEVKAEVRRVIDATREHGGYFLGSSTELHPGCRLENTVAMIETAKAYR
jgi:hypothetical protein